MADPSSDDILSTYPGVAGQPLAMAMMCQVLSTRGLATDAYAMGRAAIQAAPRDTEVRDLVRAALSSGVPAWHGPMLRDERRNRCYAEAIERRVRPGMKVLEIGAGAGLLSLLAARAGARVVTCEMNPVVAAAAADIARRNGLSDRIQVIAKNSGDLVIGEDLPEPADLLLSELFDDTLFGDGIVDVIADARARLLKPGAPVLPARAELRCALIALRTPFESLIGEVEGFDLSSFNLLASPPSARLRATPGTASLRSDAISALAMDFDAPSFGATRQTLTFTSTGGRTDGVAQWLRVDFGDGIIYENNPFSGPKSHWGAPVYPFAAPVELAAGRTVTATARLVSDQLLISLDASEGAEGARGSSPPEQTPT